MSGNLPNVNNIVVGSTVQNTADLKTKKVNLEQEKSSLGAKSTDESAYVDMETTELSNAIDSIEQELTFIEAQMESIENAINSNAKLKEKYEEEYMSIKSKIEDAKSRLETATTEEMQRYYQMRVFTLGQSLNLISAQINAVSGMIETKSETQQTLQQSYKNAYSNYEKAANTLNSRYSGVQNSTPASSYAAAAGSANSAASASAVNAVNTENTVASTYAASSNVAGTKVSSRMLNSLKGWEGLRTSAYKCPAGVWTIGYGHTGGVSAGQQISEQQAETLLKQDLAKFEDIVTSKAKAMGLELTQGQYDALVSFTYNLGPKHLNESGIMEMLKSGRAQDIDAAANKMRQYCHAKGKELPGLVSRRNTEASWLYS